MTQQKRDCDDIRCVILKYIHLPLEVARSCHIRGPEHTSLYSTVYGFWHEKSKLLESYSKGFFEVYCMSFLAPRIAGAAPKH